MKILMINVVCGIRSTGRMCTDLAAALGLEGHEVKIAYGRESEPENFQKNAVRKGTYLDVKLHGVKARLMDGSGFGSKAATVKFIKWVKDYDPDVIHLHNIHGYYLNIEVLFDYLRACGKKIIWTLHDSWAFTGHTPYCDVVDCIRWEEGCHDCPCLRSYPASFVDRSKSNWNRKKALMSGIPNLTIITPSKWLAGLVKKSYLSQYEVRVINNGIDTSQFYHIDSDIKSTLKIGDRKMLLGVSTAWDEMKGYSDYLKLADALGDGYKVVMVGLTKAQLSELPGNVLGIERTNSVSELAQLYSAADLFVNLSYCENYPTVNLEAVACGTPVLTYDVGGSSECAFDGIVVPRGDINAVVERIKSSNVPGPDVDVSSLDKKEMVSSYIDVISGLG